MSESDATSLDDLLEQSRRRRRLPEPTVRRLLRESSGLTQAEIAGVLDVDRASISRYETGERTPRGAQLDAYLDLLDRLASPA